MQERHDNDKIEPHNHNEYPLLYKEAELLTSVLGRFLECRKWNILVITWALGIFLIYMSAPSGRGLGHIYQANPSCPWYNYYIYTCIAGLVYIYSPGTRLVYIYSPETRLVYIYSPLPYMNSKKYK